MNIIKKATFDDLDAIYDVEVNSFPKDEQLTKSEYVDGLKIYPNHFLLLYVDNVLVGVIDGMVVESDHIEDEMFSNPNLHNENGKYQTILGLMVRHNYQHLGYSKVLLDEFIKEAKKEGRKAIIITCRDRLIPFYQKFNFVLTGQSKSNLGGLVWYDMHLDL